MLSPIKKTIMTCIIVDDEPFARISMKGILEEHFPMVNILAECANIPEAVKAIHKYKPQVVFLDIEMPGQNGFALLDYFESAEIDFKLVFVTAYNEYSLQAFEMAAIDYILKPVRIEHLQRALSKLNDFYSQYENLKAFIENMNEHNDKKIVLKTAESIYVVKLDDIIFIKAEGNYTKFHTMSHAVITITKQIAEFEYLEKSDSFFRSHRSYIINFRKIKKLDKKNLQIVMLNNEVALFAQDKKNALIEKIEQDE